MKNYLKDLIIKVSLFDWIKTYIHQHKVKRMDNIVSQLLSILSKMTHEEISDVILFDDYLSFKYRGGVFLIYKNVQSKIPDVAYLKVYHKTPLLPNLKEVEGLYVVVDKYNQIRMSNYLETSNLNPVLQAVVANNTIAVFTDTLPTMYPKQFHAKMLKDNFDITPYNF